MKNMLYLSFFYTNCSLSQKYFIDLIDHLKGEKNVQVHEKYEIKVYFCRTTPIVRTRKKTFHE